MYTFSDQLHDSLTYALGLPPESSIIMFAGIYYGSQYGNSISAILLNVPGTSSAVVTALEGNAMTRKGRAGPALAMSAIASFFGGTISVVALMLFAPLLSQWAIRFGPAEYFALMIFGFLLHKTGFPLASVILGLVLGPLMENNLRRAMSLSDGDWTYLFASPISIGLWVAAIASLFLPVILRHISAVSSVGEELEKVQEEFEEID